MRWTTLVIFIWANISLQAEMGYACGLPDCLPGMGVPCPHHSKLKETIAKDKCVNPASSCHRPCCTRHITSSLQFVSDHSGPVIKKQLNTPPATLAPTFTNDPYERGLSPLRFLTIVSPPRDGLPVYLATRRLRI